MKNNNGCFFGFVQILDGVFFVYQENTFLIYKKERPLNLSHKSSLYLKQTHKDYAQNQTTEKTDNISKNHLSISPFTACLPDVII